HPTIWHDGHHRARGGPRNDRRRRGDPPRGTGRPRRCDPPAGRARTHVRVADAPRRNLEGRCHESFFLIALGSPFPHPAAESRGCPKAIKKTRIAGRLFGTIREAWPSRTATNSRRNWLTRADEKVERGEVLRRTSAAPTTRPRVRAGPPPSPPSRPPRGSEPRPQSPRPRHRSAGSPASPCTRSGPRRRRR